MPFPYPLSYETRFLPDKKRTLVISSIRYFLQQRKAARRQVILKGIEWISHGSSIVFEEHAKLRHVHVELPDPAIPLRMGAYSYARSGTRLLNVREIGRYCSIGRGVTIGEPARNHPVDAVSTSLSVSHRYQATTKMSSIGHDVWIGHDAVIMAGVSVGHGAIVARNAVVTKDVEPYQIVAGVPARPVRYRFDADTREALLASQWWNLDHDALRELPFEDPQAFLQAVSGLHKQAHYREVALRDRRILS